MNRKILYRIKDEEFHCWVYGVPYQCEHRERELNLFLPFYIENCPPNYTKLRCLDHTLGQYIGICDKNDVRIFEHDIVKVTEKYSQQDESPFIMIGEIVYEDCMFGLKTKDGKFYTPIWENEELEVIGNSFDNKDWSNNNDNL